MGGIGSRKGVDVPIHDTGDREGLVRVPLMAGASARFVEQPVSRVVYTRKPCGAGLGLRATSDTRFRFLAKINCSYSCPEQHSRRASACRGENQCPLNRKCSNAAHPAESTHPLPLVPKSPPDNSENCAEAMRPRRPESERRSAMRFQPYRNAGTAWHRQACSRRAGAHNRSAGWR